MSTRIQCGQDPNHAFPSIPRHCRSPKGLDPALVVSLEGSEEGLVQTMPMNQCQIVKELLNQPDAPCCPACHTDDPAAMDVVDMMNEEEYTVCCFIYFMRYPDRRLEMHGEATAT